MNNTKKVIICMCAVMMVISLCIGCSFCQEKPSEEVMKTLIAKTWGHGKHTITNFNIINSFYSNLNGSYCIDVKFTLVRYDNNKQQAGDKYSFEKKGNQWYLSTW